jgi:hypothetical protein
MPRSAALAVVCALLLAIPQLTAAAQPCPEAEDAYAVELVLPAEVKLRATLLGAYREVAPEVYAYRSGYDDRVIVALYYSSAPPLGARLPTVRFQVPVEGSRPLFNISSGELCRVVRLELSRLASEGVLEGLKQTDVERLSTACSAGRAGWEQRLVLLNGTWVSYSEVPGARPLLGCRAPLPLSYAGIPVWPATQQVPPWLLAAAAAVLAAIALSWRRFKRRRPASSA